MQEAAARFFEAGVICLPIPEFSTVSSRASAMRGLDLEISNFPEFNAGYVRDGAAEADRRAAMTDKRPLVPMDGGELATASSFHNGFVRNLRRVLYAHARVLFQHLVLLDGFKARADFSKDFKLEELIRQLVVMPSGEIPAPKKWYRGHCSPLALPGDIFFDGWFNFGQSPQQFSYQVHSHQQAFSVAPDTFDVTRALITVNPGELLICFDSVIREVCAVPRPEVIVQLLTGWRLTHGDESLFGKEAFMEIMTTGAIVPSVCNLLPPMYLELSEEVEAFSADAIRESILEECIQETDSKRRFISVVPKHMPSMAELDEAFPKYCKQELALYTPSPLFP